MGKPVGTRGGQNGDAMKTSVGMRLQCGGVNRETQRGHCGDATATGPVNENRERHPGEITTGWQIAAGVIRYATPNGATTRTRWLRDGDRREGEGKLHSQVSRYDPVTESVLTKHRTCSAPSSIQRPPGGPFNRQRYRRRRCQCCSHCNGTATTTAKTAASACVTASTTATATSTTADVVSATAATTRTHHHYRYCIRYPPRRTHR